MFIHRYSELKKNVSQFAMSCGRSPDEIKVVVVSKGRPHAEVMAAYQAGCLDFGENRIEEAFEKMDGSPGDILWHFIGNLQSKKVHKMLTRISHKFSDKDGQDGASDLLSRGREHCPGDKARPIGSKDGATDCSDLPRVCEKSGLGRFCLIHSVDSFKLAQKISQVGEKEGLITPILLQANTSGEETKHGHTSQEWKEKMQDLITLPALHIQGLMTMAPYTSDESIIRTCFRNLSYLRKDLEDIGGIALPHLSMGMSNDYKIAIEEGATLLRIGSLLFD